MLNRSVMSSISNSTGAALPIRVSFEREFLGRGEPSPFNLAHLQIESIAPERAPLPCTETGYLLHFIDYDELISAAVPSRISVAGLRKQPSRAHWKARPEWRAAVPAVIRYCMKVPVPQALLCFHRIP